jgi:FlaA1/EpsC-like NDP-sugar epimerase
MYDFTKKLSRANKKQIFLTVDTIIVAVSVAVAFALHEGSMTSAIGPMIGYISLGIFFLAAPLVIFACGLHRIKLGAYESSAIIRTARCAILLAAILALMNMLSGFVFSSAVPTIFGVTFFSLSVGSRLVGQIILAFMARADINKKNVLIYGAGDTGIQLAFALRQNKENNIAGFVDDKTSLDGMIAAGLRVSHASKIDEIIKSQKIDRVILAMSTSKKRHRDIVKKLEALNCDVLALPSMAEILNSSNIVDTLHPVSATDLLGRQTVNLDLPVVRDTYNDKVVFVSGAGGSIGGELCRQLIGCNIRKLVLLEHSEFNLYAIHGELEKLDEAHKIEIVSVLGSVRDEPMLNRVLKEESVQIILHAAAYKHVPLVESNELAGLSNNVLGTRTLAMAATRAKVERFILISTDKAVRPTNIMGASKRMAEMVIQDFASRSTGTLFSMVRFGNVLGSSGSVIPLFKRQIEAGGPLTVTHPEVTRFFMTIPEAARLVLLCGGYTRGGDVFVLDMGKATKIVDLARKIISLSGRTVKDAKNPDGDIEIQITGLRPGEKLYEELLLGNDMLTTPHQKILRAQEGKLSELEIASMIKDIQAAVQTESSLAARKTVTRWVEEYQAPLADQA